MVTALIINGILSAIAFAVIVTMIMRTIRSSDRTIAAVRARRAPAPDRAPQRAGARRQAGYTA
jgi:hypothetical protein